MFLYIYKYMITDYVFFFWLWLDYLSPNIFQPSSQVSAIRVASGVGQAIDEVLFGLHGGSAGVLQADVLHVDRQSNHLRVNDLDRYELNNNN